MTNLEYAECLRALATLYEVHPELKLPCGADGRGQFEIFCHGKLETAEVLRAVGSGVKTDKGDYIRFEPERYPSLLVTIFKSNVCERVVVGEEMVPEVVISARAEEVIPAYTRTRYEWRCGALLDAEAADV